MLSLFCDVILILLSVPIITENMCPLTGREDIFLIDYTGSKGKFFFNYFDVATKYRNNSRIQINTKLP